MKKQSILSRIGLAARIITGRTTVGFQKRRFEGGGTGRLTEDLETFPTSADFDLRQDLGILWARSRSLEENNDYAEGLFKSAETNVIGPLGIQLDMKLKGPDGKLLTVKNSAVEAAWKKWGKRKNCTVQESMSWHDLQRLAVRSLFRDGGLLIRKRPMFDNEFKFALQPLEVDHLDRWYSGYAANGNEVRLGVETDQWKRVTAYYIIPRHPGDFISYAGAYARERVPADQIIHLFMRTRVEQSRGVPFLTCSILRLSRLGKYEQAEVDQAYEASCKGGFIENENPVEFDGTNDGRDNQTEAVEQNMVRELDPGQKFQPYDPTHPTDAYAEFTKQQLRGTASGQGISYATWTSDLAGANFSSMRAGLLPERDRWMMIQNFIIEALHEQVFTEWTPYALLSGQVQGMKDSEAAAIIDAQSWNPRRWGWVDPAKDLAAKQTALELGIDSRQNIVAETGMGGGDFEEICKENAQDKQTLEDHGLNSELPAAPAKPTPEDDDLVDTPEEGDGKSSKSRNGNNGTHVSFLSGRS